MKVENRASNCTIDSLLRFALGEGGEDEIYLPNGCQKDETCTEFFARGKGQGTNNKKW